MLGTSVEPVAETIQALLFDFDGLIVDSEGCVAASWKQEWSHFGLNVDLSGFGIDHSPTVTARRYEALARRVGPQYDRSASHARRIETRDRLLDRLQPSAGIAAWLAAAEGMGLRLAIVSGSSRLPALRILRRLGWEDRFQVMVFKEDAPAPKPDPSGYLLALDRLGLTARQAIAFEDSPQGVRAAVRAGLRCVGIPNPLIRSGGLPHARLVVTSAAVLDLVELIEHLRRLDLTNATAKNQPDWPSTTGVGPNERRLD